MTVVVELLVMVVVGSSSTVDGLSSLVLVVLSSLGVAGGSGSGVGSGSGGSSSLLLDSGELMDESSTLSSSSHSESERD